MSDTTQQTETEFDDERDEGTPEPTKPGEAGTVIDLKANPAEPQEGPRALTKAAELVPVKQHGAAPANFAHQITLAQYMAKAALMVPEHFHGNVGDCLAIIDIAQRAGLSPYMVAAKTYKDPKGKGIAFESQLYHAFLIGSGWLKDAALNVKYDGEGEARTCTVWGTLKGEDKPRSYTSPPLKDLLPRKNSDGVYKGSPLWGDKPDVQMFYDTSRDWSRMFAPIATLGMLAQYESIEHPIAPEPTDAGDGLRNRLKSAKNDEGHKPGHAEQELANVAAETGTISPAGDGKAAPAAKSKGKATKEPPARKTVPTATPAKAKPSAAVKAAADRAQALGDARRREAAEKADKAKPKPKTETKTDDPPAKVPTKPKTAAEYQVYALDWIGKGGDPEAALARWDKERDTRDDLQVRLPMRNALRAEIEKKHGI